MAFETHKPDISHLLIDPIIEAVMFCSKLLIKGMCFDKNDLCDIFNCDWKYIVVSPVRNLIYLLETYMMSDSVRLPSFRRSPGLNVESSRDGKRSGGRSSEVTRSRNGSAEDIRRSGEESGEAKRLLRVSSQVAILKIFKYYICNFNPDTYA